MIPMALFGTYARFEVAWRYEHFRPSTVIEEPFPKQTVELRIKNTLGIGEADERGTP
jgi:hypothetical protein